MTTTDYTDYLAVLIDRGGRRRSAVHAGNLTDLWAELARTGALTVIEGRRATGTGLPPHHRPGRAA